MKFQSPDLLTFIEFSEANFEGSFELVLGVLLTLSGVTIPGKLRSYWTTAKLRKLTVVLDYSETK